MAQTPGDPDDGDVVPDPAEVMPETYLAGGWRDQSGALRPELAGLNAFGPALRFQRADVPPAELAMTLETLRQVLPDTKGPPQKRLAQGIEAALEAAAAVLRIDTSEAVADWLIACARVVRTDADLDAFLAHFTAVARQYAALAAAVTGEVGAED